MSTTLKCYLQWKRDALTIELQPHVATISPQHGYTVVTIPLQSLPSREVKLQPEDAKNECRDYIKVYDGHASWSPKIQDKFCGDGNGVVNEPIISRYNKLRIKFVSDKNFSDKGFMFTYDPYQPPKGTRYTVEKEFIYGIYLRVFNLIWSKILSPAYYP